MQIVNGHGMAPPEKSPWCLKREAAGRDSTTLVNSRRMDVVPDTLLLADELFMK